MSSQPVNLSFTQFLPLLKPVVICSQMITKEKKQVIIVSYSLLIVVIFCLQVTDFAKYGNILEARSHCAMSVFSSIQIATQIASALEYLGSKGLVHLRINAASIFVVAPGKVHDIWFSDLWCV